MKKNCKHSWMSTALQNILEVLRTLELSLRKRWTWLHPHQRLLGDPVGDWHFPFSLPPSSSQTSVPHSTEMKLFSLLHKSMTQGMPPTPLAQFLQFWESLEHWSSQLGFLPCMNFRGKCQPALKLSVDFSSKFKTLINLFTAAVAVINVLYVFPFWKMNTEAWPK